jgi:hypothetical protein
MLVPIGLRSRSDQNMSDKKTQRVRGSVHGERGSFLLQDSGTLIGSAVSGAWFVVPDSGTDELRGLRGTGGFEAKLGENASIWLDYPIE